MSATFTEVKAQAPVCGEFEVWKPCSVNCGQPNCAQEPEICEQVNFSLNLIKIYIPIQHLSACNHRLQIY